MGNPFQEETGDLLSLDTKDVAHPSAAEQIGLTMRGTQSASQNS